MSSSVCAFGVLGLGRAHHALDGAHVVRRQPAEAEGAFAHLDGRAVELDGLLDGRRADRHAAELIGVAQQEHVGGNGVAEQLHGGGVGIEVVHRRLAGALRDGVPQRGAGDPRSALRVKSAVDIS